jgi:hypothetical protein
VAREWTLNRDQRDVLRRVALWLCARAVAPDALHEDYDSIEDSDEEVNDAAFADPGALGAESDSSDAGEDVRAAAPAASRRLSAGAAMDQQRDSARAEHAVCVVHGVFGAGKSHMLEAVLSFLADALGEEESVLFAATTNTAVDRVMGGLLARQAAVDALAAAAGRAAPGGAPNGALDRDGGTVSCILCTVTFHANHAHNLTRSP